MYLACPIHVLEMISNDPLYIFKFVQLVTHKPSMVENTAILHCLQRKNYKLYWYNYSALY